ncbi:MAG: hypothetical protein U0271_00405 [Polyangiaceae bacterium]
MRRTFLLAATLMACGPSTPAESPHESSSGTATASARSGEAAIDFCGKSWPKSTTRVDCHDGKVTDLSPLAGLSELEILDVGQIQHDATDWKELTPISAKDLSPLAGLRKLRVLSLYGVQVSDLKPLAGLKSLEKLILDFAQVSDLAPIRSMTGLKSLSLQAVPTTDFAPLTSATGLEDLGLESTSFSDTRLLQKLPNLVNLRITSTAVTDLTLIAKLPNLEYLVASGMNLDFAQLVGCKSLKNVGALGVDEKSVASLKKLKKARPELSIMNIELGG